MSKSCSEWRGSLIFRAGPDHICFGIKYVKKEVVDMALRNRAARGNQMSTGISKCDLYEVCSGG